QPASRREPPRCTHLHRAPGGWFDGAPREKTACRNVPAREWATRRLLTLLRRKRTLVRLPQRGLQAVDQGLGGRRDGPGRPDRSRPVCRRKAAPRALRFSADPPLYPRSEERRV